VSPASHFQMATIRETSMSSPRIEVLGGNGKRQLRWGLGDLGGSLRGSRTMIDVGLFP
jgi:hypothetical protein